MDEQEKQDNKQENADQTKSVVGDTTSPTAIEPSPDAVKTEPPSPLIRENLVSTAIHFLQNPRVAQSPLSQKRLFLLKKGLSHEEIDLAIERAASITQTHPIVGPPVPISANVFPPFPSIWVQTTNLAASLAIIGGFVYSAYLFYKKYIEEKLFGHLQAKKHPLVIIQEQITQLTEAINSLKESLEKIESNMKKQIELEVASFKPYQEVSLYELKTEINSIKALLLNRHQFAATPIPSIPTWQLENKTVVNENEQVHMNGVDINTKECKENEVNDSGVELTQDAN